MRRSARIHGDHLVSFPDSCVSLPRHSHRVMFLGHLHDEWLDGLTVPLLAFPGLLSFALTYSRDSLILRHPAIDLVWQCPCLPRLRLLWPLAIAVHLVVFTSWLAPSLIPHRDICLSFPALDACCAMRLGWRTVPASHFQDSVSCLTCSQDSQLLRHPAIDIGGVGPVFLALGCSRPLASAICWVVFLSWLVP